jgi:tungstate transport system ATP-binding protein
MNAPSHATAAAGILPLRLSGLSYRIATTRLLDSVDLLVRAGPRTIVLGPNGAGKTLLLRIAHGLIEPSEGRVEWLGPEAPHARLRQAMVFQRPVLLRRSVGANIAYALKLRRLSRDERRARLDEALQATGLGPLRRRAARVLSGGEQQRVALARAWALRPEVLFLDEPTASLDPAATRAIESLIEQLAMRGVKVVMTTHDLGQAQRLADEIVFMHGGRVIETAPAAKFFAGPSTREASAFLKGELLW